jgi:uncharacterized protein
MPGLPATAAWRHVGARQGFEVLFLGREGGGYRFHGHATAVEDGEVWSVHYTIDVDSSWRTRRAHVASRSPGGMREVVLEGDGRGEWSTDHDGAAPELTGILDVDLEASAFTNAFPVHRLRLSVGEQADAPAAYVRAQSLDVARLEQRYARLPDEEDRLRYDYEAPAFEYRDVLVYDEFGLVLDYPGIAVRDA